MGFAYNIVADKMAAMDTKERAQFLLQRGEPKIPPKVIETFDFLDHHGVWYIASRNSPATSCRDASSRRYRLGNMGIKLSDELKSHCVVYYDQDGRRAYIILHCRGNLQFDLDGISKKLNASRPLARLAPDELKRVFDSEYGTVTPFVKMDKVAFQIFDEGIFRSYCPPHTMMTNAGAHTWAVEFKPKDLVDSLLSVYHEQIKIRNIARISEPLHNRRRPRFGIITGNGPESGMVLWKHLNRYTMDRMGKGFKGDLSFPSVTVHSIPEMGLSMELEPRESEVWLHLKQGVQQLCENGVTHIALACHTTHYFSQKIKQICEHHRAEFVSMAETTMNYIEAQKIKDLTVIGIPYVADLGKWSAYHRLSRINVHPVDERAREPLLELGYWVKKMGADNKGLNMLNHILKIGVHTTSVLLALTEISVLLEGFPKKSSKIGKWAIIDPLRIYGQKLADIYLHASPEYQYLENESGKIDQDIK